MMLGEGEESGRRVEEEPYLLVSRVKPRAVQHLWLPRGMGGGSAVDH